MIAPPGTAKLRLLRTDVADRSPQLTMQQRVANARAGLCHCGCPSLPSGNGWRRCVWSRGVEFRVYQGKLLFRGETEDLRGWNDAKSAAGLPDDRQVHALLRFMTGK